MGRDGWFFRADGLRSYDNLRDAFVGERLGGGAGGCDCFSAYGFGEGAIDCGGQLRLLQDVMIRILRQTPTIDVGGLCDDLFAGQRRLCEHYLWWLESESLVTHPRGQERQDRLLLTDEGCVALAALELTRPGSNVDLSPQAIHLLREREGSLPDLDRPRFLRQA
jgi:hypothetical protein